jgi:hypothetical protein
MIIIITRIIANVKYLKDVLRMKTQIFFIGLWF